MRWLRINLGTRIFLMTAVLVSLAVGVAVFVTTTAGGRIAYDAARQTLNRAGSVQSAFQEQRYRELDLNARLFAADVNVVAYVAESLDRGDAASVLDQLEERQAEDYGWDFAMILDSLGTLVARTDDPNATGEDLSDNPLVAVALREYQAAGFWREEDRLYQTVAVPLTADRILIGYLVAGFALDDLTALQVSRVSDADVAYLTPGADGPTLVAGALESAGLAGELSDLLAGSEAGERFQRVLGKEPTVEQLELELSGRRWLALMRPLTDAEGTPIGAAVALASLDPLLAPFRRLDTVLLVVGLAAILLAGAASFWLSRRVMRPVRDLTRAADAAREGDYAQRLEVRRKDEVGHLADAFDHLLSELREKQDMESYITSLNRTLGEAPERTERAAEPTEIGKATVLLVGLGGFASPDVTADPEETLSRMTRDRGRARHAIETRGGAPRTSFQGRVAGVFRGEDRSLRALAAAHDVLASVGQKGSAFDSAQPPTVAVAEGEVLTGAAGGEPVILGTATAQAEGLLRETQPGELALAPSVYKAVSEVVEAESGPLPRRQSFLGTGSLYLLSRDRLATATSTTMPSMDRLETLVSPERADALPRSPLGATMTDVAPGTVLGERFEILSVLGSGGMGVVYKARDRELDELVALKMLRPELASSPEQLERLKSELKLARRITHPNVLRTYDFGEIGDRQFISMEYVRGITLRSLLQETGTLPFSAGLRIARQLCRGLAAAHAVGVLHRDIKPENLVVEATGNAKLMDFGIARPVRRSVEEGATEAGMVVGTPHYLAPEQIQGREDLDERADLFAVGVVFYEIFTGHLPFEGRSPTEIFMATLREQPPAPRSVAPDLPATLEELILECLAKERDDRPRSAERLLESLNVLRA